MREKADEYAWVDCILAGLTLTVAAVLLPAASASAVLNITANIGMQDITVRNSSGSQFNLPHGYRFATPNITHALIPSGRCMRVDALGTAYDKTVCTARSGWTSIPATGGNVYIKLL